jgi:hypothetical protein
VFFPVKNKNKEKIYLRTNLDPVNGAEVLLHPKRITNVELQESYKSKYGTSMEIHEVELKHKSHDKFFESLPREITYGFLFQDEKGKFRQRCPDKRLEIQKPEVY